MYVCLSDLCDKKKRSEEIVIDLFFPRKKISKENVPLLKCPLKNGGKKKKKKKRGEGILSFLLFSHPVSIFLSLSFSLPFVLTWNTLRATGA